MKKAEKSVSFDSMEAHVRTAKVNSKYTKHPIITYLISIIAIIFFAGDCLLFETCSAESKNQSYDAVLFSSFRDIPGVTADEIAAVEEFQKQGKPFIYGIIPSTEAFLNSEGEVSGYSTLICEWLTTLFGIQFISKRFSWSGLLDGLNDGSVHFTGDLTVNDDRRKTYFMTDVIAQRSIRYFSISDNPLLSEISKSRLPRYLLPEKTTIASDVMYYAAGTFEPVFIHEYDEAYALLKSGEADFLITEGVQEAIFDVYDDVVVKDFFPMIYSPVSLSTQDQKLSPFISVVQKALENGIVRHLNDLYDQGYNEYLKNKLFLRFTEEERAFISEHSVVPFAAEYDNYPISFYSVRSKEWEGICFDVIKEIESLTGLKFFIINDEHTIFSELVGMLESGEASLLTELIPTLDRQGRFLWPENSIMTESSVLVSRLNYRNININRIYSERIGLSKGTAHTEFFTRWFPNHLSTFEFDSQNEAFEALIKGDVDLVMSGYIALLYLTNYQELAGFKTNVMFDNSFVSTFGVNLNQGVLCSIIDKTLELIDTRTISERWRYRTYDYRLRIEQARTPWLIGLIVLSLIVLTLVIILFLRSNFAGKRLEQTVQKRTYELAFQTTTLSTLFDSIPDLIFTKNLELKFLHCNKAFLEHFNRSIDDVVGVTDGHEMGLTKEEAHTYNETDHKVINEKRTIKIEEVIPRFDGSKPLYETIKMPMIMDGEIIGIMGVARDITQRKEMEAAALAASQSKSAFLANMSHEIRTPMNAILGVTEILIQSETISEEVEEGLDKIYRSCDLLLGIINDILDFSKIEAGKLDIMPAQYNVASMINDSIQLNMMRLESKPIKFKLDIEENVPAKLIGDELRIKQILNNLLSNAFKYTDAGKITLSVVSKPLMRNTVTLEFRVRDTGHGMTNEQLGKMFDEYSRFLTGKNISVEGTGLGLAITQRLVSLMYGEIHVDSEFGKGSLFTVKLPQDTVDSEVIGKELADNLSKFRTSYLTQRKRGQITRDPMPYGKVLIVDDVETNLYVAVGLMKLYKLQIDTAMGGQSAIDKIKEGNVYDVIFMDHMMPEIDGVEAMKKIRELGYVNPIVVLTANAVAGQADIFLNYGFDEFISKPIDIRQLNSILERLVRDKYPQEVIEEARRQQEIITNEMNNSHYARIDTMLIDSFLRDAEKALILLENQIKNISFDNSEDNAEILKKFTIAVHGIKSSLWNIGEKELADFALKLEEGGRKSDGEYVKKTAPDFINDLRLLLKKIDLKRGKNIADNDIMDLRERLYAIKEKASGYNRKEVLDIIAGIKNPSIRTKAVLDNIAECAIHSEFEKAESAAAAYAAELSLMEKQ